jgi:hypothetical protein
MKILFVQLPNQDSSGEGARDNVPVRTARLAAYLESKGVLHRDACILLDQDTADHGGDAAVAAEVLRSKPDLVVFTLLDYNLDRSLWLARRLRQAMPATHFVAGGPEVVQGMAVFKAHVFDALVEGEFEEPFVRLLSDLESRSLKPRYSATRLLELASLPDPYLAGILPIRSDKPVIIESARGASNPPAFRAGEPAFRAGEPAFRAGEPASNTGEAGPRYFDKDLAPRLVRLASEAGAEEARFIDPRIDGRADFKAFVKSLAAANEKGVALGGMLDPAVVDDETARLLAEAGFVSAGTDLASVNPKSLAAVGLSLDKDGFERGSKLLWGQGIVVRPTVYLGLPHETHQTLIDTFDFLGMVGMGQDAELQPLPVLPGTRLRTHAADYGIKEFLERPPYWTVETEWMDEDDFLDAVADFEESFDVSWGSPVAPNFKPERGGFTAFADLRTEAGLDSLLVSPEKLASSLTLLLDADDPERVSRVVRASRDLRKENQYTLWQIVLYSNSTIPSGTVIDKVTDAFAMPEHYFELSRLFSLDPQPQFQVRAFFATSSEALALVALRDRQDLETVFVLGDALPGPRLVEALPFLAFDREKTTFELLYDVMSAWRSYPDLLVEAPGGLFR